MRPLKLTLAGFRSYSKEQSITFDNKGLFAIIGDTGAGKSTILEGIVFALYNLGREEFQEPYLRRGS